MQAVIQPLHDHQIASGLPVQEGLRLTHQAFLGTALECDSTKQDTTKVRL